MSWNNEDNENFFIKLKSKSGRYHVVLTTTKTSRQQVTRTITELQQLPEIEMTDTEGKFFFRNGQCENSRRKYVQRSRQDSDKLSIVVYRGRNKLYLKDSEIDLHLTENHRLFARRVYLSS